jgi:hypothetical protein
MNMEKIEKKLKQLFSELRAQDSRRVPSFNSIAQAPLESASTGRTLLPWPRFALPGAAVALLIGGIVAASFRAHTHSFEKEMHGWAALSDWEAPTDALLSISETPWDNTITSPSDLQTNYDNSSDTTTEKL